MTIEEATADLLTNVIINRTHTSVNRIKKRRIPMLKIEVIIYILLVLPCLWLYIQNIYLETTKRKLLLQQQLQHEKKWVFRKTI